MNRRDFIRNTAMAMAAVVAGAPLVAQAIAPTFRADKYDPLGVIPRHDDRIVYERPIGRPITISDIKRAIKAIQQGSA